jgi:aspartyl-tRNA(Asn)/glutamyl-tRNA(Gln) amidotransferase subunit C
MSVDAATVKRIAHLARIKIDDAEVPALEGELNAIIGWIEQLGEVDTSGVEPMTAVIPIKLKWREDVVTDGDVIDKVLANAPASDFGFYAVPKVIE